MQGRPRATFRFYEELNDFLAPALRRHEVEVEIDRARSVKDAMESLGVPHPEVDLILVDGASVDFTHLLRGGERVAVALQLEARLEPFTRCRECNTRLEDVAPEVVSEALPPRVRGFYTRFKRCPGCARIYWEGTHYARMRSLIERLRPAGQAEQSR